MIALLCGLWLLVWVGYGDERGKAQARATLAAAAAEAAAAAPSDAPTSGVNVTIMPLQAAIRVLQLLQKLAVVYLYVVAVGGCKPL